MQVYSFPILSEPDLLSCLRDMELPLTAAQLAKPAPEVIMPLYETFVTTLGGVSRCLCALHYASRLSPHLGSWC